MLLNVPAVQPQIEKQKGLRYLAIPFAGALIAEMFFILRRVPPRSLPVVASALADQAVGTTWSIGVGLFTGYLLPFEVTSVLILMAVVGAMVLARREGD